MCIRGAGRDLEGAAERLLGLGEAAQAVQRNAE
jgi:hypothetical protein